MTDPAPGSRPDRSKAIAVDAGLDLLNTEGRAAAAAFMEDAGVPLAVIARVLNEPDRRRLHQPPEPPEPPEVPEVPEPPSAPDRA